MSNDFDFDGPEDDDLEADVKHPPWYLWCQKNSQPKSGHWSRPKRELTPWQKRGPMTRRDWVRFYNWAAKNAIPRELIVETPVICDGKKKDLKKRQRAFQRMMAHLVDLSAPRWPRDKYEYPKKPFYPYSPKIHWRQPAHHDPLRPLPKPKVPKWFHHLEVEMDFWWKLRFPVIRSALYYEPTENTLRMAEPRVTPPLAPHCPIPQRYEVIMKRRRMSRRQWREHLRRLEYLAKPVWRPVVCEGFYC